MGLLDGVLDDGAGGLLVKMGVFVIIQALVYLILSASSTVFSEHKATAARRLDSFRRARSLTIRRVLAAISDVPPEHSPSSAAPMPTIPEHEPED